MDQIQNITEPQPYLTLLPENEDVFAPDSAFLAKHLLPLVSIDLSAVNPEWRGKIHLVNPIEPADGSIGMYTEAFHNNFAAENWFILQLDENNHYQWLADKHYFILQNENPPDYVETLDFNLKMHKGYNELKQRYLKTKTITSQMNAAYSDVEPSILLNFLGGDAYEGNWRYPIEEHLTLQHFEVMKENDEYPSMKTHIFDQEGKQYHFIASATAWQYCESGADDILMFYQPETRRVLFTFDWT